MLILRTIARHTSPGLSHVHPMTSCLSPLFVPLLFTSNICPYVYSPPSSVGPPYLVRPYPLHPGNTTKMKGCTSHAIQKCN